jgi:hypothetical protein
MVCVVWRGVTRHDGWRVWHTPPRIMAGYTRVACHVPRHVGPVPRHHVWRGSVYLPRHAWWRGQTG